MVAALACPFFSSQPHSPHYSYMNGAMLKFQLNFYNTIREFPIQSTCVTFNNWITEIPQQSLKLM